MFSQVWGCVARHRSPPVRGTVRGFSRRRLRGAHHPGLTRAPDEETVQGVVYLGVDSDDLAALDRFEGSAYVRTAVPVELETGERLEAWTYLIADPAWLEDTPWDPEEFGRRDLPSFLRTHCPDTPGGAAGA